MRIDFTNAVVEDDGYGVEVNGRSLEAIISTALGTRLIYQRISEKPYKKS